MTLELIELRHGGFALLTNESLPGQIHCVEYFKRQRYIQFNYNDPSLINTLIEEELSDVVTKALNSAPDEITIIQVFNNQGDGISYKIPICHILN